MGKTTKVWLTVAAGLILIGCFIFGGVMTMLDWNFTKLSTSNYETNTYCITESYQNIRIKTNTANITLIPAETTTVICYEEENLKHTVTVDDGTLIIELSDTRKWYEHIGINFSLPKVTVAIPQGNYGTLSVKCNTGNTEIPENFTFESIDISTTTGNITNLASASQKVFLKATTGDIKVENVSAGDMEISVTTGDTTVSGVTCQADLSTGVSTGKTKISNTKCQNLTSSGTTGSITLSNAIASGRIYVTRTTGNVKFEKCDGAEIFVKTDTGNVNGSFLSDKVYIAQSDTGKISVPKTTVGGKCEITTDTGDIKITVE